MNEWIKIEKLKSQLKSFRELIWVDFFDVLLIATDAYST